MYCASFFLTLLLVAAVKSNGDWNYSSNGNDWEGVCQTGKRQSPINIHTKWTLPKFKAAPLKLTNYDQDVPVSVTVDQGHYTISVRPDPSVRISISGGGLRGTYVLQQAHFHFGSEHLFNSKRYPLEAHLVHYRDIYGNLTEPATNDPEGIAVLGTLYCQTKMNENIQKVIDGANGQTVTLNFRDFLPKDLDFYRYQGSLTTPPCSEAVVWSVFKNTVSISKEQVDTIRSAFPEDVQSTYRNVQPLNGRIVERWNFGRGIFNKINFLKSPLNVLSAQ